MALTFPTYITIRDGLTFEKEKAVTPMDFTSSLSLFSNGPNTMTFSLPIKEGIIEVGKAVTYADLNFGGIIESRDIDNSKGIARYSGKSWRGIMDNWIADIKGVQGHGDGDERIVYLNPGNSQLSTDPSTPNYPNNGAYPLLDYLKGVFDLPIALTAPASPLDIDTGYHIEFEIPNGATLGQICDICGRYGYNIIVRQPADRSPLVRISFDRYWSYPDNWIKPEFLRNIYEHAIYTKANTPDALLTGAIIGTSPKIAYYNAQTNKYTSGTISSHGQLAHTGLNFQSLFQEDRSETGTTNIAAQNALKTIREQGALGVVSSEFTMPPIREIISDEHNDTWHFHLGDRINVTIPGTDAGVKQALVTETLRLVNGQPLVTYSFGA